MRSLTDIDPIALRKLLDPLMKQAEAEGRSPADMARLAAEVVKGNVPADLAARIDPAVTADLAEALDRILSREPS